MSKEGFNWKSIFIVETPNQTTPPVVAAPSVQTNSFPNESQSMPSMPAQTVNFSGTNNPFLEEIKNVYEKGFDSLNVPNFDFFEFYKSVISVGVNNSQSYTMAFAMGSAMNKDLNKTTLLEKASFYTSEIEKVHKGFLNTGVLKKKDLFDSINMQKKILNDDILDIENKIAQLQNQLSEKKNLLNKIDAENSKQFLEFEQKLEANEFAKQKLISSINQVVTGINQYL